MWNDYNVGNLKYLLSLVRKENEYWVSIDSTANISLSAETLLWRLTGEVQFQPAWISNLIKNQ